MPLKDEQSPIEDLKDSLYSRNAPDVRTRRKLRFLGKASEVKTSWQRPPETPINPILNKKYEDHSMSFITKIFIGSLVFCVLAIGIGVYLFLNGANLISANNIGITINGPVSIPGGEPVSFDVVVTNNNNVDLQLVDMSVQFPAGTTDSGDTTSVLQNYQKLIGDMPSGGKADEPVSAIIFGQENDQKQITVTLTYSVKGSSSVFTKTQTYDVLISSSPINVSISSIDQVTSGQQFSMKVDLKSNSKEVLKNVIVKGSYPFGFTFLSSNLKPQADNASWTIGDIQPGGERVINITGQLQGEDSDTRVFHFTIGAQNANSPDSIGTQYADVTQNMTIQKPFISTSISVGGDQGSGDAVGQFDQPERIQIAWFNNLQTAVANAVITAKLSGTAYDKDYVQAGDGDFRSASDEIVWNQETNPELAQVAGGASGILTFSVTPKDLSSPGNQIVNPMFTIQASVSGDRTQETNVSASLNSVATRNVRIASDISLSGRLVRSIGPFMNIGPIPPKADSTTTYTVIWTVDNTSNLVGNAQVTANLPPYVSWVGSVSPASENVTYDHNSGTVTWSIGNIGTYTLTSSQRREVYFQIAFLPSVSQVGQTPTLVGMATLAALDNFTGASLKSTQDLLVCRFSTDPAFNYGDDLVIGP